MPEDVIIDKTNKLPPGEDYNFLRREGIRLIESLSGKIWTDYNTHDPGITLLEAICYTLTDLAYRTSFDIKDILATKDSSSDKSSRFLYTAREVLPCNPVTLIDFRKMIVDIEGVRNAWIEVSNNYEIFMFLDSDVVTDDDTSVRKYFLTCDTKGGGRPLHLRGLYKVFVEYESGVKYTLEEEITKKIKNKLNAHRNLCEDFLSVTSIEYELFKIEADVQVSEGTDIERINAEIYDAINNFLSPPITFYSLAQMLERGYSAEEIFEGPLLRHGFVDSEELQRSERYKEIHVSDIISLITAIKGVIAIRKFSFPDVAQSTFSDFSEWMTDVKVSQKAPRLDTENSVVTFTRSGDRHRSLAEKQPNKQRVKAILSFLQGAKVKTKLNGIANDIAIPTGEFMDLSEYYPFQKSLPASYGMSENFLDYNVNITEINKVIDELIDEKVGAPLREVIRLLHSQEPENPLIVEVLDQLTTKRSNEISITGIISSLLEDNATKDQFKRLLSRLSLKEDEDFSTKQTVKKLLELSMKSPIIISDKARVLRVLCHEVVKVPLFKLTRENDISKLRLAYKSYQVNNLDSKKKLSLQLRGFLMVFEQILSDYLSQLASIKDLFSFNTDLDPTFLTKPLNDISDIELLFIDYNKYKRTVWENSIMEANFIERRNRVLDHLIGRFAEDMSKYSSYIQSTMGNEAGKVLVEDKMRFLSDYVKISSYRGKAFDYSNPELIWNEENVPGIKKRLCRLLGIQEYHKKFISSSSIHIEKIQADDKIDRYIVVLNDPENKEYVLLKSGEYEFESEAYEILNYLLRVGINQEMYEKEERKDRWSYRLKKSTQEGDFETVASREFRLKEEFESSFKKTINTLRSFSKDENFHMVEHILLRPKILPREKNNKKNNNVINTDSVDLLSVANVFTEDIADTDELPEPTYKFRIINIKDQGKKDRIVWRLVLLKNENSEVLIINEDFIFYKHVTRRVDQIQQYGSDRGSYLVYENADGYFNFSITSGDRTLAVSKKSFRSKVEMESQIDSLISYFSFEKGAVLENAEDYEDVSFLADPYSLQVSLIVPDWPAKFRNPTFKHLFEKTVYMEIPSHIYCHLYWIDHRQMREFEEAYNLWLEESANVEIPSTDVVNNLVFQLNELRKL